MSKINTGAIGIFDSGVGGLSIAKRIKTWLPNESIIYIADSFHSPYGCKSEQFIQQRADVLSAKLVSLGCKLIVVACNTATVNSIAQLRQRYAIPFIGVEPGIKPAVTLSKTHHVGVLATQGTINSRSFNALIGKYSPSTTFHLQACVGLAEQVERGELYSSKTRDMLLGYLSPIMQSQADTLVLGCTHYPFLTSLIKELTNNNIALIDTSDAVAKQTKNILASLNLENEQTNRIEQFYYHGDIDKAASVFNKLWGDAVDLREFVEHS